jgi:hypothetical protein
MEGQQMNDERQSVSGTQGGSGQSEATPKPDGLGDDGTIPPDPNGIAAGHSGRKSTFEPEEEESAE